jgi:hypothetical protein
MLKADGREVKLAEDLLAKYETHLNRGAWPIDSDPVCISADGEITSGRWCLRAIMSTGFPAPCRVFREPPEDRQSSSNAAVQ